MKLRLGAAVVLAVLTPLTVVTTSSPAHAGVDITPPEVGSCHDITYDEAWEQSDPQPAVPCSDPHTTMTVSVMDFGTVADWDDERIWRQAVVACYKATSRFFGDAKTVQMSAYTNWSFRPTDAQREAGAAWIRCDVALQAGERLRPLPTDGDPQLGSLPHPRRFALCRKGKATQYLTTTCDAAHAFRAKTTVRYPADAYPGRPRRLVSWTIDKCRRELGRSFALYEIPTRWEWIGGMRNSICYTKTRR